MDLRDSLNVLFGVLLVVSAWSAIYDARFFKSGSYPQNSYQESFAQLQSLKTVQYIHDTVEDLTSLHGLVHKYENFLGDKMIQFEEFFYKYRTVEKAFYSKLVSTMASIVAEKAENSDLDELEQKFNNGIYGSKQFQQRLLTDFQRVFESIYLLEAVSESIEGQAIAKNYFKIREKSTMEKYSFVSAEMKAIVQQYLKRKETENSNGNALQCQAEKELAVTMKANGRPEIATYLRKYLRFLEPETENEPNGNCTDIILDLEQSKTFRYIQDTLQDMATLQALRRKHKNDAYFDEENFAIMLNEFHDAKKKFISSFISTSTSQSIDVGQSDRKLMLAKIEQDFNGSKFGPPKFCQKLHLFINLESIDLVYLLEVVYKNDETFGVDASMHKLFEKYELLSKYYVSAINQYNLEINADASRKGSNHWEAKKNLALKIHFIREERTPQAIFKYIDNDENISLDQSQDPSKDQSDVYYYTIFAITCFVLNCICSFIIIRLAVHFIFIKKLSLFLLLIGTWMVYWYLLILFVFTTTELSIVSIILNFVIYCISLLLVLNVLS